MSFCSELHLPILQLTNVVFPTARFKAWTSLAIQQSFPGSFSFRVKSNCEVSRVSLPCVDSGQCTSQVGHQRVLFDFWEKARHWKWKLTYPSVCWIWPSPKSSGFYARNVLSDIEFRLCQEITTLIRSLPLVILQEKSRNWTSQLIGY